MNVKQINHHLINRKNSIILLFTLALTLITLFIAATVPSIYSAPSASVAENTIIYLPIITKPREFEANPSTQKFNKITDIANSGDGRLFIIERAGTIRVVQPDGTPSLFLDIQDRVTDASSEQGLFAIAFPSDYTTNGSFYVSYTGEQSGNQYLYVSRFQVTANPDVADPNSEDRIFSVKQDFGLHNGGALRYNPVDGYLYVGVGDDEQLLVAQDLGSTKGKLIRLSINSPAITSSPEMQTWLDAQTSVPSSVWALGLRNPWKIGIDPVNGSIFVTDVGDRAWEEVNYIPLGAQWLDFGWPCMEGPDIISQGGSCGSPSSHILPVYYYSDGCAIMGGEVYYHLNDPAQERQFIFGDYCTREIMSLSAPNGSWQVEKIGAITDGDGPLTTLGKGANGTIYAGLFSPASSYYELFIPPQ